MTRCKCCHRYAPKTVIPGAPGEKCSQGGPVGTCDGTEAIEEARNLARLWRQRALAEGWGKTPSHCGCGATIPQNRSECDACFECEEVQEKFSICLKCGFSACKCSYVRSPIAEIVDNDFAGTLDRAMDAEIAKRYPAATAAALAAEPSPLKGLSVAYCQGDDRHACVIGSPFHEQMLERGCFHCGAYPE